MGKLAFLQHTPRKIKIKNCRFLEKKPILRVDETGKAALEFKV
jgi:hypothetical protein